MLIGVTCSDHGVAIFAKIIKIIFHMLLIIGPILCMVSLGYLFIMIITSSDADAQKVYSKRIKNVFIALFIVVLLPTIVNLVMGLTMVESKFQVAKCWDEAGEVKLSFNNKFIPKVTTGGTNTSLLIEPGDFHHSGINGNPNSNMNGGIYTGNVDLSTRQGQIQGAINWAVAIANDDSFNYGPKPYSSRCGCYFCGTNGGKKAAAKGHPDAQPPAGKTWDKTYVCMTFINAAYAHGAQDPIFLKHCKRNGTALDGEARIAPTLRNLGDRVSYIGHPDYSKLEPGDILFSQGNHVSMYIGKGKFVEASGGGWDKDSIAVKDLKKSTYNSYYDAVLRYNGH